MGMIACPECGTSISDRARVCMNCGYCGTEVDRPIGEQNEGNLFPHINVEFERWDPSRDESTFVGVPMAPQGVS